MLTCIMFSRSTRTHSAAGHAYLCLCAWTMSLQPMPPLEREYYMTSASAEANRQSWTIQASLLTASARPCYLFAVVAGQRVILYVSFRDNSSSPVAYNDALLDVSCSPSAAACVDVPFRLQQAQDQVALLVSPATATK